jgi:hypothetical protein
MFRIYLFLLKLFMVNPELISQTLVILYPGTPYAHVTRYVVTPHPGVFKTREKEEGRRPGC